jgi:hypothetical protein
MFYDPISKAENQFNGLHFKCGVIVIAQELHIGYYWSFKDTINTCERNQIVLSSEGSECHVLQVG